MWVVLCLVDVDGEVYFGHVGGYAHAASAQTGQEDLRPRHVGVVVAKGLCGIFSEIGRLAVFN